MKQVKKIFSACLIISSLTLIICSNLYAGIAVDPITIETTAEIGKELVSAWKVTNTGSGLLNVNIVFEDWLQKGTDPNTWLKVQPQNFSLEPKKSTEVKYTVNLPEDVSGEVMAMVFFNGKEQNASVGVGFGVPVYIGVKGTETVKAEITDSYAGYTQGMGINGWLMMKNNGNVHIRPYTTINVLDKEGKAVSYFTVKFGWPIQAGKRRRYDFFNKDIGLQPGKYKILITSFYGKIYGLSEKIIKEIELTVKPEEKINIYKREKKHERKGRRSKFRRGEE